MLQPLTPEYHAEVGRFGAARWDEVLAQFRDANLYQTSAYGAARWGESRLRHVVIYTRGRPVGAAQVQVVKPPLIGALSGVAYIAWGPMWRPRGEEDCVEHLRQTVRALVNEFATKWGLYLTISPLAYDDQGSLADILCGEGLKWHHEKKRTVIVDLGPDLNDIRKNLVPRWRTELNRSERNELSIIEGTSVDLFHSFRPLYVEMKERKKFVDFVDLDEFARLQELLPDPYKMRLMLCHKDGRAVAGAITSLIGDVGLAILWATSPEGRAQRAAYFLQWRTVEWLKASGCSTYDLRGVSREINPGGYRFKLGLAGKNAQELGYVGSFAVSRRALGAIIASTGIAMRDGYRAMRSRLSSFRRRAGARPGQSA